MNVKEILNTYGEYGLTYDAAKEVGLLDVQWHENYNDFKKYTLEYIATRSEESLMYLDNSDIVFEIYLEHLNMELTGYKWNSDGHLNTDSVTCTIYTDSAYENNWECYGFIDLDFDLTLLESKEELAKAMFYKLIDCAKENNLTWSKPNFTEEDDSFTPVLEFSGEEYMNQIDVQIQQRADNLGLSLGEYFKRLAMTDIRGLDGLEVEPEYRLN